MLLESLEDRSLLAFDVAVSYAAGAGPQAVVSAHFNSGGLDLAVANYNSSTASVRLGERRKLNRLVTRAGKVNGAAKFAPPLASEFERLLVESLSALG